MCKAFEDMKEEGRAEGIKETALKMLKRGKQSIEEIAEYCGFETGEVEQLARGFVFPPEIYKEQEKC